MPISKNLEIHLFYQFTQACMIYSRNIIQFIYLNSFIIVIIINIFQVEMLSYQNRIDRIIKLHSQPSYIRNISIVAHVDHGKTTLADSLISSNGIFSKRLVGQLKYMDARNDEQDRGITMKSSNISLLSKYNQQEYLINLIDSPGHIQFGFQVATALRLTDGALVVVDVLEGVSSQTYRVLMQTFDEKVASVLVLNKIDKLIRQLKMSPLEAYRHINQIIEQVNAILGSFINLNANKFSQLKHKGSRQYTESEMHDNNVDELQDKFYFSVQKNNIVFCSALDNWGFTPKDFAPLVSKKLGIDQKLMEKYLWGEYYYHPKQKQVLQEPRNQNDKPLCVDFILQTIWSIYDNVFAKDTVKIEKIINFLGIKINQKLKNTFDYTLVKEILNNWLPLDRVIFRTVIQTLPNPVKAQKFRLSLLYNQSVTKNKQQAQIYEKIRRSIQICDNSPEAPIIIFVSKMISIPKANFNQRNLNQLTSGSQNKSLGFARIYSGTLKRNQDVYVIGPKIKKTYINGQLKIEKDITKTRIQNLYILMGQCPQGIPQISAGNVFGIGNLENVIYKTGTVSDSQFCPSVTPLSQTSKSILKVSVTTPNLQKIDKVIQGLKKLNKSDPSVEVYIQKNGDIILNTCGQVHLQRCIADLQSIYAQVPIKCSEPIINFRQTITWKMLLQNNNEKIIQQLQNKKKQQLKKQLRQRLKKESIENAELDQFENQKLKAIQQWDFGVEKYESEDFTVEDTRFFFKNRDDLVNQKQKYVYKTQKEFKKVDYKNKGKSHAKQNILNLSQKTNISIVRTPNQILKLKIKAIGINFEVAQYLQKNNQKLRSIFSEQILEGHKLQQGRQFLRNFEECMLNCNVQKNVFSLIKQKLYCFGPNKSGPNLFIIKDLMPGQSLFDRLYNQKQKINIIQQHILSKPQLEKVYLDHNLKEKQLINSLVQGFDITTMSGPMCEEPIMGAIFIVQQIQFNHNIQQQVKKKNQKEQKIIGGEKIEQKNQEKVISQEKIVPKDVYGPFAGQIMSTVKEGCLQAFLGGCPHLVQPLYQCNLQTQEQYYGNVHSSLSKRRAKIISEDIHQSSHLFLIKAHLPVIESLGFCDQMLTKTQGRVNAQLQFDTWKIFEQDPFYVPLTKEEIEENGIENIPPNAAKQMIQKIRKMKGLITTQKIVVAAQKQRTLKRK